MLWEAAPGSEDGCELHVVVEGASPRDGGHSLVAEQQSDGFHGHAVQFGRRGPSDVVLDVVGRGGWCLEVVGLGRAQRVKDERWSGGSGASLDVWGTGAGGLGPSL